MAAHPEDVALNPTVRMVPSSLKYPMPAGPIWGHILNCVVVDPMVNVHAGSKEGGGGDGNCNGGEGERSCMGGLGTTGVGTGDGEEEGDEAKTAVLEME